MENCLDRKDHHCDLNHHDLFLVILEALRDNDIFAGTTAGIIVASSGTFFASLIVSMLVAIVATVDFPFFGAVIYLARYKEP